MTADGVRATVPAVARLLVNLHITRMTETVCNAPPGTCPRARGAGWWLALSLALLSFATASVGRAQDETDDYRRLVDTAVAEYGAAHYEEARALFVKAHALDPTARTGRGLGMASFELRDYVDSIRHLEQALHSTVRPLDGELRANTVKLLARARDYVATLVVETTPADAQLRVDDALVSATSEHPLLLNPGEHQLVVQAPGHVVERRELAARGGQPLRLRLSLQAEAVASARPRRRISPLVYTLGGVGVVGLAAFAGFGIAGKRQIEDKQHRCEPRCSSHDTEAARRDYLAANVAAGVGGAALLTAVIVYFSTKKREQPVLSHVSASFPLRGVSLTYESRF